MCDGAGRGWVGGIVLCESEGGVDLMRSKSARAKQLLYQYYPFALRMAKTLVDRPF